MARKKVTFRVFVIKNEQLTHDSTDLKDVLRAKLGTSTIESRLQLVREGDDSEKDLLGSFAPATGTDSNASWVFGTMMRLKPAKELKAVPDNFAELPFIPEDELRQLVEIEGKTICSSLYHFMIQGKYLVTDLPQIQTINSLQKYLNNLLSPRTYGFAPLVQHQDLKLKDIETVTFKDSLTDLPDNQQERGISLKRIVSSAIRCISPNVTGLNSIMDKNMVAARMTLSFKRPKKMSIEEYTRKLSAVLAPVQDLDNVFFTFNDGRKLLGSEIVRTYKETLEDDVINQMTYIRCMREILNSIEV